MTVLERSELESSPLADLHAIADQLGLEGFRRLRKADLIDAILGEKSQGTGEPDAVGGDAEGQEVEAPEPRASRLRRRRPRRGATAAAEEGGSPEDERAPGSASARDRADGDAQARTATGVVEVLGNGSAFLRVSPPEPSDEDVYISAAQVRRCELVSGDEVSGPVRTPRRSERYPSLVRVDTINGSPAEAVSDGSSSAAATPRSRRSSGSRRSGWARAR
jgi:transcription termination factor Rho